MGRYIATQRENLVTYVASIHHSSLCGSYGLRGYGGFALESVVYSVVVEVAAAECWEGLLLLKGARHASRDLQPK